MEGRWGRARHVGTRACQASLFLSCWVSRPQSYPFLSPPLSYFSSTGPLPTGAPRLQPRPRPLLRLRGCVKGALGTQLPPTCSPPRPVTGSRRSQRGKWGLSEQAFCLLRPKDGKDLSDTCSLGGCEDGVTSGCVTYLDKCIPDQFVLSGKLLPIVLAVGSQTGGSILL